MVLENRGIARVRRVVRGAVVDRAARREAHARQRTVLLNQMADAILHVAADVVQLHARLDLALDVRAGLAVHLRRLSVALDLIFVAGVAEARFLARRE